MKKQDTHTHQKRLLWLSSLSFLTSFALACFASEVNRCDQHSKNLSSMDRARQEPSAQAFRSLLAFPTRPPLQNIVRLWLLSSFEPSLFLPDGTHFSSFESLMNPILMNKDQVEACQPQPFHLLRFALLTQALLTSDCLLQDQAQTLVRKKDRHWLAQRRLSLK